MHWRELVEQWKSAHISDAAFILLADEMQKGKAARYLIQQDFLFA